jgi:ferredoxin-NADP reductase
MTTTAHTYVPERTAPAPGPRAPRFAFPVIDRVIGAQATRVLGVDSQTPTGVRLRLERPMGYQSKASQHALLRVSTSMGPDLRPLSLAGAPEGDHLEFATRRGTSAFKEAVLALRPGDMVKVSRPMGGLRYDASRPAVFIAGGIGITPVRSLLLDAGMVAAKAPVRLLFSNHTADEIAFVNELTALVDERENLMITWVLTSPSPARLPGPVHAGRLTAELLHQHAAELPDALFYLTGPAAMVHDVHVTLRSVGVARRRIQTIAQGYRPSRLR